MTQNELLIINFKEIRRRSIKLWKGIPNKHYGWKPDKEAFTILEMIRHVLEGEHLFHQIVINRGNLDGYVSPWTDLTYSDLKSELEFAKPYRKYFLDTINEFHPKDFTNIEIIRSEKGQRRLLGDYLQRIAYHEAVHTGQMLSYLRTLGVERPQIWD